MKICVGVYLEKGGRDLTAVLTARFRTELPECGLEVDTMDSFKAKDDLVSAIEANHYDLIIVQEVLRDETIGTGLIHKWASESKVILLLNPNRRGGRKLQALYEDSYYDGLFMEDLSGAMISKLFKHSRSAEYAGKYYNMTPEIIAKVVKEQAQKETEIQAVEDKVSVPQEDIQSEETVVELAASTVDDMAAIIDEEGQIDLFGSGVSDAAQVTETTGPSSDSSKNDTADSYNPELEEMLSSFIDMETEEKLNAVNAEESSGEQQEPTEEKKEEYPRVAGEVVGFSFEDFENVASAAGVSMPEEAPANEAKTPEQILEDIRKIAKPVVHEQLTEMEFERVSSLIKEENREQGKIVAPVFQNAKETVPEEMVTGNASEPIPFIPSSVMEGQALAKEPEKSPYDTNKVDAFNHIIPPAVRREVLPSVSCNIRDVITSQVILVDSIGVFPYQNIDTLEFTLLIHTGRKGTVVNGRYQSGSISIRAYGNAFLSSTTIVLDVPDVDMMELRGLVIGKACTMIATYLPE